MNIILSFFIRNLDLTNPVSLKNVCFWKNDIVKNHGHEITTILCATKKDLESNRQITEDEIHEIAELLDVPCVETSALTGLGVETLFNVALDFHYSSHIRSSDSKNESTVDVNEGSS